MDSLTQATLGTAVSYACWHRQLGRWSLFWGALLGTLPDLDVFLYPLLDEIQRLYWHRGETHSVVLIVLGSLLLGPILRKTDRELPMTLPRFAIGVFLILLTHVLIDYFTIYGTQLLAPFSRYGFARGNLFIVDPLYTIPLLCGLVPAVFGSQKWGSRANTAGLIVSTLYIALSLASHTSADGIFQRQLQERKIVVLQSITSATPFNTLLWRHIARTPDGIMVGYFSHLADDPKAPIAFELIKRNEHLIEPLQGRPNVEVVEWFSKGFWVARQENGVLTLSDLRFGEIREQPSDDPEKWTFLFTWQIASDSPRLQRFPGKRPNTTNALQWVWRRIWSNR
jgi:inner membrane protein